jgi:predicted HicB family RNase H-like nuclease
MKKKETENRRNRALCLRVTEDVRSALKRHAEESGLSQNQIIDFLLRNYRPIKSKLREKSAS